MVVLFMRHRQLERVSGEGEMIGVTIPNFPPITEKFAIFLETHFDFSRKYFLQKNSGKPNDD